MTATPSSVPPADTSYAAEELLPLLSLTALPKQTAALSAVCRHPVPVRVALDDFVSAKSADERAVLLDWLDNSRCEGWGSMFALLNARMPFGSRLHGIRIEPATSPTPRLLLLDGSDLVYRMHREAVTAAIANGADGSLDDALKSIGGAWSDAELDELLPGVLAALPHEPQAVGQRLVPFAHEAMSLGQYERRVVPRAMRRVAELVGKSVVLDTDFRALADADAGEDARSLYWWGLNRIVGGLALACMSFDRRMQLNERLTKIRFRVGRTMDDRRALYGAGVLDISVCTLLGEAGSFFERDIDRVLEGERVGVYDLEDDDADERGADSDDGDGEETDGDYDDTDDADAADDDGDEDDAYDPEFEAELEELNSLRDDDEDDDIPDTRTDAERARELNDENFRSAAASLKEHESMWAMQLEMIVGHPVALTLDFDSLGGRFELVQPFIHQGLTSVLEAFGSMMGATATWGDLFARVRQLTISGGDATDPCVATLSAELLSVRVPLTIADVRPPTATVLDALRTLIGLSGTSPTPTPTPARAMHAATKDPYELAAQFVVELEAAMRAAQMWPGPKPPGDLEVKGAFGMENMAFSQWLAWVFIPRVLDIVNTRGSFPSGSNIAGHAVRELDGLDADDVLVLLHDFDRMVEGLWT